MTTPQPPIDSFQETFCAQYGVPPSRYNSTVLWLTLYSHARWLTAFGPDKLLELDRSFVASVGQLRRWRDFSVEAREFQRLPGNRRFWRRRLRLRVSVRRMQALFSEVMGGTVSTRRADVRRDQTNGDPGSLVTD